MTAVLALLTKIASSSTFWVSVLLPLLKLLLQQIDIDVPWEAVMAGQGAYGVKEAAAKLQPIVAAKAAAAKE
jgi:hypothetical protein